MIEGLSHITFIVEDLQRSSHFFKYMFDAKEVYSSGADSFSISPEVFLLVNDLWIAIMQGESKSPKTYNHIAFRVSEEAFSTCETRARNLGIEIKPSRNRIDGEGKSLYFYDYDNHLFEIHTGVLSERLSEYSKHQKSSVD